MAFHLYSGNKLEELAGRFCREIYNHPGNDPMTGECVIVQTRGMGSYLQQFIARESGIAANLEMPFPQEFLFRLLKKNISGFEQAELFFSQEAMEWEIFSILNGEPQDFPELAGFMGSGNHELLRLWQFAKRIAALFDRYQIYRYQDEYFPLKGSEWQTVLWKKLLRKYGKSRMACCRELLASEGKIAGLPERLTVFGAGSLPPLYLDIFFRIAMETELHFFYLTPCQGYWGELASRREQRRMEELDVDVALDPGNPLLASWGESGRELFSNLLTFQDRIPDFFSEECFSDYLIENGETSLLKRVQQDILDMRDPGKRSDNKEPAVPDSSLEIISSHGPRRELEILHDKLLEVISAGNIDPKDIIVMAPDINSYLPYIEAIFGKGELKNCYTVADRNLHSNCGIGDTLKQLLRLPFSRMELTEIMGIAANPAVCRAFGLASQDIPVITAYLEQAGVRWGLDEHDRENFCRIPFKEFSWYHAIDRIFELFACGESELDKIIGGNPLLREGDLELFGKFNIFIRKLEWIREQLNKRRTLQAWMEFIRTVNCEFFAPDDPDSLREQEALNKFFNMRQFLGKKLGLTVEFPVEIISGILDGFLNTAHDRFSFLRGRITFCSLTPLRSIPAQIIAVLGMDEGKFPRRDIELSFDMMNKRLIPGDRSRAKEDRYLFLEALLSARRNFWCFYHGRSRRTGKKLLPSMVVGELLEYLKNNYAAGETEHLLQGFDAGYFTPSGPLRSWSKENFSAACKLAETRQRHPAGRFAGIFSSAGMVPAMLPLDDLVNWAADPVGTVLKERCSIRWSTPHEKECREPFKIGAGLERHQLNRAMLNAENCKISGDILFDGLKKSNLLPPGVPGELEFKGRKMLLGQLASEFKQDYFSQERMALEFRVGEQQICGIFSCSPGLDRQTVICFGSLRHKYYVSALIRHHGLCMISDADTVTTRLITLEDNGKWNNELFSSPGKSEQSVNFWKDFLQFYREGAACIPPFFPESAFELFKKSRSRRRTGSVWEALLKVFDKEYENTPAISSCFTRDALKNREILDEFLKAVRLFYGDAAAEVINE